MVERMNWKLNVMMVVMRYQRFNQVDTLTLVVDELVEIHQARLLSEAYNIHGYFVLFRVYVNSLIVHNGLCDILDDNGHALEGHDLIINMGATLPITYAPTLVGHQKSCEDH
jgi:hypothetical protein